MRGRRQHRGAICPCQEGGSPAWLLVEAEALSSCTDYYACHASVSRCSLSWLCTSRFSVQSSGSESPLIQPAPGLAFCLDASSRFCLQHPGTAPVACRQAWLACFAALQ